MWHVHVSRRPWVVSGGGRARQKTLSSSLALRVPKPPQSAA